MDKKNVQNQKAWIFYVKFATRDDKKKLPCGYKKNILNFETIKKFFLINYLKIFLYIEDTNGYNGYEY